MYNYNSSDKLIQLLNKIKNCVGIVVAGGSGVRFLNSDQNFLCPKQYLKIGNEEIIRITVNKLLNFQTIFVVIIVVRQEDFEFANNIFQNEILNNKVHLVIGGKNRIDSVINGVNFINKSFSNKPEFVIIHDAVRPLIDNQLLKSLVNKISSNDDLDAVLPIIKINDALKRIENNKLSSANREEYCLAQTPQIFRFRSITECIEKHYFHDHNNEQFHDEIGFLEKHEYQIGYVNGCTNNIKITNKDDFMIAEYLLEKQKRNCDS